MAAAGQHGEALRGGIRGGLEQCVPDRGGLKGTGGVGASAQGASFDTSGI